MAGKQFKFSNHGPALWVWLAYSAIVVVCDQLTKLLIVNQFALGSSKTITSFFNLVHVHNPGAAFSFLASASGWQKPVLIGVAIVAIVVVLFLLAKHRHQKLFAFAMASILGGAIGNVIDRATYGVVIDFLDVHWGQLHWPAFNVADMAISGGAIAIVLDELRRVRGK